MWLRGLWDQSRGQWGPVSWMLHFWVTDQVLTEFTSLTFCRLAAEGWVKWRGLKLDSQRFKLQPELCGRQLLLSCLETTAPEVLQLLLTPPNLPGCFPVPRVKVSHRSLSAHHDGNWLLKVLTQVSKRSHDVLWFDLFVNIPPFCVRPVGSCYTFLYLCFTTYQHTTSSLIMLLRLFIYKMTQTWEAVVLWL